ncbi:MAG: flavin reductase [Magnetovibrio sp.]|nr:flavin reductase [Magnetovibrio sp.]|tara:strand:+ start:30 stop:530 length:501 start_codon:yes stop_codon:yes gene_type:complete
MKYKNVSIDQTRFRSVLGLFATGVTIVTGMTENKTPVGLTVNAFTSLSLSPPLVLFCLDKKTASIDAFDRGNGFALNMLNEDQKNLSVIFSTKVEDRFAEVDHTFWDTGVPILNGCLANLECKIESIHSGGDHLIIVGLVERLQQSKNGRPLLYFKGDYAQISTAK